MLDGGTLHLQNLRLLDVRNGTVEPNRSIVVSHGKIEEVRTGSGRVEGAEAVDLGGRVVMPGLIDSHVHAAGVYDSIAQNALESHTLLAFKAGARLSQMLDRGFTTVRDLGGADSGLVRAVEEGLVRGPRLVISGSALSQTGGHCDYRAWSDSRPLHGAPRLGALGRLCDGVPEVRKAAREELRAGAHFIKIMANGGVGTPTDPLDGVQFSVEEIKAIVEEAKNAGTYVAAHVYTDESIERVCVNGVHSLEHCNLISERTADKAAQRGCISVPTLIVYDKLWEHSAKVNLSPASMEKLARLREGGRNSLKILMDAGVEIAYGSDLMGSLNVYQSEEFPILEEVLGAGQTLRAATITGAKLCRMEGQIGEIVAGAFADLLVVDGNPLDDLSILSGKGERIRAIMKGGRFVKNALPRRGSDTDHAGNVDRS